MAVVATGFFDGVHLGHRQVIQTLVSSARERGEEAIVVTFAQHPRAVLQQDARTLRLLNSPQEKEALLRGLGVDRVETLPFDRAFARLTAEEYLRTVLRDRLGATLVVLGYDNRLGSDCLTPDAIRPLAESLGLEVVVVPPTSAAKQFGSAPLKTSGVAGPLPSDDGPLPLTMPRVARFSGGTAETGNSAPAVQPVVREVQTFYEQLFLEQGYPITYLSFVIDHEGPFVSPRDPEQFDSKAWRAAEGPRLLFGHDSAETRRQKLHAAEE
jgi:FAD synthase